MQSSKSPVPASGKWSFNIAGDWMAAVGIVAKLLFRNGKYVSPPTGTSILLFPWINIFYFLCQLGHFKNVFLLIVISTINSVTPFPWLLVPIEELIILCMAYDVIKLTWEKIEGAQKSKQLSIPIQLVYAVSFMYWTRCFLLSGIKDSIALAVACVEGLNARESFARSNDLLKGNTWTVSKYMFLVPGVLFVCLIGWNYLAGPNVNWFFWYSCAILQLCTASVMVRLYVYAKERQEAVATSGQVD